MLKHRKCEVTTPKVFIRTNPMVVVEAPQMRGDDTQRVEFDVENAVVEAPQMRGDDTQSVRDPDRREGC